MKNKRVAYIALVLMLICCFTAIACSRQTDKKESVGVYHISEFPYTKDSEMKKALKQMDKPENYVYVKNAGKIFTNDLVYKQTTEKTDYIYYGEIKKGAPDGYGIIFQYNGGFGWYMPDLAGNFKNGAIDGYGYDFSVGSVGNRYGVFLTYEGQFKDGVYSGKGKDYLISNFEEEQNELFEQYFQTHTVTPYLEEYDKTVYLDFPISASAMEYEGEYQNGVPHGKGVSCIGDTVLYEGEYKNGKKDGKGTEYYKDGKVKYTGTYKNDMYDGKGTLYNEDGSVKHKGKFKKGLYE